MTKYFIVILQFVLLIGCATKDNSDIKLVVINNDESIEKGIKIHGKKEGYWINIDTNYILRYDCVYKNDSLNGPVTFYRNNSISAIGEMKANKRNGKWIFYHNYPKPYLETYYKKDSIISTREYQDE